MIGPSAPKHAEEGEDDLKPLIAKEPAKHTLSTTWRFNLLVVAMCLGWYATSTMGSVLNKVILIVSGFYEKLQTHAQDYQVPFTIALVSLLSVGVFSEPMLYIWKVPAHTMSVKYQLQWVVPISAARAIAATSAYASLSLVPISYSNTGRFGLESTVDFQSNPPLRSSPSFSRACSSATITPGWSTPHSSRSSSA